MEKIKLAIVGFGNIGRCVLKSLPNYPDFECVGIITRNPARVAKEVKNEQIYGQERKSWTEIGANVAILCGGSKNDLPVQGPMFARHFNTVCSFDTHAHIGNYRDPESGQEKIGYYQTMNNIAASFCHTSMICQGWDPGIFSMMRALFTSCLGGATAKGFYGLTEGGGLSMGHSDAIRTIPGVKDARQYTHAIPEAIELMRSGINPELSPAEMHWRECFVVAEDGVDKADKAAIEAAIINMPDYFAPYNTTVVFVSQEELDRQHSAMPHDGLVLAVAEHGLMEFRNVWKSNPQGTAGILLAFARAAVRFNQAGKYGAFTVLDVPVRQLLPDPKDHLKFI